jgi:hypothetical protein
MSGSNAAAIRRRVTAPLQQPVPTSVPPRTPQPTSQPTPQPTPQPTATPTGLTLQQFISALDKRVASLETSLNTTIKDSTEPTVTDIIDEFNTRFEMFATEIADMKDMILKLQSYTMDVNKMLLEERIDILSDVNPNNKTNTVGIDTDLTSVVSLGGNTVNTAHSLDMRELVNSEINKDDA